MQTIWRLLYMSAFQIYALIINIIGFFAFGIDKLKARHHKWRISEFTLMLLAVLGGGIGCFLGMRLFHHKTRHTLFTVGIPVIVVMKVILWFLFLRLCF